jgi:polysaccharide biosynthesis protein PslJ
VRSSEGHAQRGPVVEASIVVAALAVVAAIFFTGLPPEQVVPVVLLAVALAVGYRVLLTWHVLLAATIAVIMFIPIRRYSLPVSLPFELEPYRVIVAFVALGWLFSLLVDPSVRFRASGLDAPLVLFIFAVFASVAMNGERVSEVSTDVVKQLAFFLSFFIVFYLVVSVAHPLGHIDFVLKVLVGAAAVIGFFVILEARNGFNVFDQLSRLLPLDFNGPPSVPERGGRLRAYGSAQHAIAMSAAFALVVPMAVYLAQRTGRRLWLIAGAVIVMGALATVSRTGVLMLFVIGLVFLWLRPAATKRLLPALLPLLIVVHFAVPATLGPLQRSFFPSGGLIAEQRSNPDTRGSGRLADLGPSFAEWREKPLLGQGFGTRIVDRGRETARILDNQWLGTLLETGIVGAGALLWLFVAAIRRFSRAAKLDDSDRGWFFTALTASVAAFAVGMLTYDAFAFIQVTFLLFFLLAFGAAVLRRSPELAPRTALRLDAAAAQLTRT